MEWASLLIGPIYIHIYIYIYIYISVLFIINVMINYSEIVPPTHKRIKMVLQWLN
jgi:hypothetical protein